MIDKESYDDPSLIISNSTENQQTEIFNSLGLSFKGTTFFICSEGEASIRIDSKEYEIKSPSILTIFPRYYQFELLNKTENFSVEYIYHTFGFGVDAYSRIHSNVYEKIEAMPCLKISDEEMGDLREIYLFIAKQYNRHKHPSKIENVRTLLSVFVSEINHIYSKRDIQTNQTSRQEELIKKFFELLHNNHQQEHKIAFYAKEICLSPKYLTKIVRRMTGRNIPFWIDRFLISSAKAALRLPEKTVLQISEELNFANPSFFGRFFKKYEKMTPTEYRNSVIFSRQ